MHKRRYYAKERWLSMTGRSHFPVMPIKDIPEAVLVNGSKKHRPVVLVVDDESAIADTLAEILALSGYAAMPVYDGEEALETALLMPPELLITDVMLPGMSGIELAIQMRRIFPDCGVLLFRSVTFVRSLTDSGHCVRGPALVPAEPQEPTLPDGTSSALFTT